MLILSFSGHAEYSLTLKSLEVLEHHPEVTDEFDKIIIKASANIDDDEWFSGIRKRMEQADVIIWAASPYHMNIPSHLLHFFEKCRQGGVHLKNVNTLFITNVRVCDNFLTNFMEKQIKSIADTFITGLSYGTPDMFNQKLSLYRISTPDLPPKIKKSIFGKEEPPEFKIGEGLRNAVAWWKLLRTYSEYHADKDTVLIQGDNKKDVDVLFVDMDIETKNRSRELTAAVNKLRDFYIAQGLYVQDIAQRDYQNIHSCDGCSICYASKECKFRKDDFASYETRLDKSHIIIFYGKCDYGNTSYISKRLIDREVRVGLMPNKGVLPEDVPFYQSWGYILDCNDGASYESFREYHFGLESFNVKHFLGVYSASAPDADLDEVETMGAYSLLLYEYGLLPQRNWYSEKIGHHFSDLSVNIPMVLPEENKYYRKAGAQDPVPVDPNARTIMPDTFKIGMEMRMMPYKKTIEALDRLSKATEDNKGA